MKFHRDVLTPVIAFFQPRKATEKEILLCHTKKYYDTIKSTEGMYMDQHKELSAKYDGVYFHNVSDTLRVLVLISSFFTFNRSFTAIVH